MKAKGSDPKIQDQGGEEESVACPMSRAHASPAGFILPIPLRTRPHFSRKNLCWTSQVPVLFAL